MRSETEIEQMIVMIMSRHGHVESHKVRCNFNLTCSLATRIRKDMMPHATVIVYQVVDKRVVFQGETTITTDDISSNNVS